MAKLFKFVASFVLVIVLLLVLAGVLLHLFFDPNDYKAEIIEQVKAKTGRDLSIGERIDFSVFPWLALKLGDIELKNSAYFNEKTTFAKVQNLDVRVKIKPLLSKRLEVDTVILKGLVLNLEKNKAGIANWQDLAGAADDKHKPKKAEKPKKSSSFKLNSLTINGIQFENAQISWLDKQQDAHYQLDSFDLILGSLQPNQATSILLKGQIKENQFNIDSQLDLKGMLTFSKDLQHFILDKTDFSMQATGDIMPAKHINLNLKSNIDVDLTKQLAVLKNVFLDLKTSGAKQIPFNQFATQIETTQIQYHIKDGLLNIAPFSLNVNGNGKNETVPFNRIDLQTKGRAIDYAAATEIAKINGLQVVLKASEGGQDLRQVDLNLKSNLTWSGRNQQLHLPQVVLKTTVDGNVLPMKKLNVDLKSGININLTPLKIDLKKMSLGLNQSNITGNMMMMPNSGPLLRFDLVMDTINLDDYIKPTDETVTETTAKPATKINHDPLAALRPLNIDGKVKLGQLKTQDITAKDLYLNIKGKKGDIKISRMGAKIYGGKLNGSARLDARNKTPRINLNQKLSGIKIGQLLQQFAKNDKLEGKGDLNLDLTMRGLDPEQIKKTLNGQVNFIFYDGALKGMNFAAGARQLKSILSGGGQANTAQKTDFSELSGSAKITNGVIKNKDLKMMSQLVRVQGKGDVNLPKHRINYLLRAKVVKSLKGQGGMTFEQLPGVPIAIRVKGDLANPKKELRLGSALKQLTGVDLKQQKQALKDKANARKKILEERLKQKINDKLGGELGDEINEKLGGALKGLFR